MNLINWSDFEKVELRVGTIISAEDFLNAKKPAYKLKVDFGPELGVKKSSAQITKLYKKEELIGRQVLAVINFPPKQVADFISECLVTGFVLNDSEVVLASVERAIPNGTKLL